MRTFDEMHDNCNRAGHPCSYWGERGDWLVLLGRSRDSDALERSNWEVACRQLDAIDPDCYAIENESHWAVGWVEALLVDPSNAAAITLAEEIRSSLEDYPVLDDSHFSETEFNEYLESWDSWARRDYIRGLITELESREFHQCAALLDELSAEVIDELVEHARQYVNWEYCGEEINIAGLVQSTRDCDIVAVLLSLIDVDAPVITLDTIEACEVSE